MTTLQSILIIVTSFGEMPSGELTGIWLEEFAVPYVELTKRGYQVSVASIEGGQAPIDPRSLSDDQGENDWDEAINALENTLPLSSVDPSGFSAVLMPGGHGTMFDFPESDGLSQLLSDFAQKDKIIASLCHGPASLINVKLKNGMPFVSGKKVTSFTNEEEAAAGLSEAMPFLLERRLRELGAQFIVKDNWSDHVEVDGKLITGQNPQSSKSVVLALIEMLESNLDKKGK